jgi:hypothetical protein
MMLGEMLGKRRASRGFLALSLVASLAPTLAFAQAPPPPPPPPLSSPSPAAPPPAVPVLPTKPGLAIELSTLHLLLEKGVISPAEYASALRDIGDTSGSRTGDDTTVVVGKFAATIYGFIEADSIWDSTQSFNDDLGNAAIAQRSTYAGSHSRVQFGIRNSRLGIRIKSPATSWFRAAGVLEGDFEGATLPIGAGQPYYGTEAAYFNNPTFRLRHAYLKFETPIVDILMGQTWHPYGWGANYLASSVNIMGIVGQIYNRTTQIRLSHTFASDSVSFELAVAAVKPPQRDAGVPEGTAGFQLAFPRWAGMQTLNATGTRLAPASIAVTADVRKLELPPLSAMPTTAATQYNALTGTGIAVDAFIPVIPATPERKGNSLSITGEVSYGHGISDLYTSLTGGVSNPALPNPMMTMPAPTYTPDLDPGIAAYNYKTGQAETVQWTTFNVGVQYYFPRLDGRLWVSSNYLRASSANSGDFLGVAATAMPAAIATAQAKVRSHEDYYDANIFGDPYPGVRFGLGYAHIADTYLSGVTAVNHRVQFSGFYIF